MNLLSLSSRDTCCKLCLEIGCIKLDQAMPLLYLSLMIHAVARSGFPVRQISKS
jgi:hypothetical protein